MYVVHFDCSEKNQVGIVVLSGKLGLSRVAVNQNTPAPDADVPCIIILLTLQKLALNGLLHLLRSKSRPASSLQLIRTRTNKLHDLTG